MKITKKILIVVISLIMIFTACFIAVKTLDAQESKAPVETEELEIIDAEDLGIKTKTEEEEKDVIEMQKEIKEVQKEDFIDAEVSLEEEEEEIEVEEQVCPDGMSEGYESGVYFEPNCFDCELHEYCYKCENHEIETEYFWDEDINPRYGWVYSETCVVCGHGTCKPVKEIE